MTGPNTEGFSVFWQGPCESHSSHTITKIHSLNEKVVKHEAGEMVALHG